jgi:hypothetical protein
VTHPEPAVQSFVAEHFIAVKLMLNNPADQPHFRAQRVIWTPTIAILLGRGVGRYQKPRLNSSLRSSR